MSRILGILALLGILGAGAYIGLRETGVIEGGSVAGDSGSSTSSSVRKAGTTSSTIAASTTTTVSAGGTATSAPTSSTAPGAATTTTAAVASTTTTSPGGSVPDCGKGVARAVAGVTTVEGAYELTAMVRNDADRAIEIDTLAVRATYPGPRTATFPSDPTKFAGARVEPAQEVTFAIRESRAAEAPTSFEMAEFSYHTANLPQCKSS
jgi:hypothetical protein